MTSMIDVVFLLLIFFMVTSSFIQPERDLDSNIKTRDSSSAAASDLEPAIVEIVQSGGRFVFKVGALEVTSLEELTEVLRQFPNKLDGAYVRGSDEAPWRMSAAAIQACKDSDFTTVSYVPPK